MTQGTGTVSQKRSTHATAALQWSPVSHVILAIVNAKYKFVTVYTGSHGREWDRGMFIHNKINFSLDAVLLNSNRFQPFVIVGDEAFRLHRKLMKPYQLQARDDFDI